MKTLTFILILISFGAWSETTYNSARGFYFYKTPPAEESLQEAPTYPKPALPSTQAMMEMHPEAFRVLMEKQLDWANYTYAEEDVKNYWRMVDVARRRARSFMGVTEFVMMKNPHLDMRSVDPVNKPGRTAKLASVDREKRNKIFQYSANHALIMFASQSCGACKSQMGVLDTFTREYGMPVRVVDIQAMPHIAQRFGVTRTPHTIIIQKDTDNWLNIGLGMRSLPTIVGKTYSALRLLNNEITPRQFYNIDIPGGELYDPSYTGEAE